MHAASDTVLACVGLGANLGDARKTLFLAHQAIGRLPYTTIVAASPVYRSTPLDAAGPDFHNAVLALRTALEPMALLAELQRIELAHGRIRSHRNAPRTLDLDLLLYGDLRIATPVLTVPHPRMQERAFVLRPLVDVLPDIVIPSVGRAIDLLPGVAQQSIERLDA